MTDRPPTTVRPTSGPAERIHVAFLVAQAAVGVLWWVGLSSSATVRSWFELDADRPEILDALILADVAVIIVGSLLGAWGIRTGAAWALPVVAFVAGGLVYVTLYLMAWFASTGEGALCFVVMVPPATLTTAVAHQLWRGRVASP